MVAANEWHEYAPQGAVFFFDEAQNIYRPRSSSGKVPENVAAFEVHRHKGLDFFLITQNPSLIDSNLRALVSRHIHLRVNWRGRQQFEWPECKNSVQSTGDAIKSSYTLPKHVFELYQSASLHTKQPRKVPLAFYVIIALVLAFAYFSYSFYSRMYAEPEPDFNVDPPVVSESSSSYGSTSQYNNIETDLVNLDFTPSIRGVLESAPAYSQIVKVRSFPSISACISGHDKCTCYTSQLTVYPTTIQQCLDHINRDVGSFNPFLAPPASYDSASSDESF